MTQTCSHSDAWLMLPWLANGRLSGPERTRIEEHVRECAQCTREVALQRQLCEVLTEPERVTYAPGPSFRKLMDRVDGREPVGLAPPMPMPGAALPRPPRVRAPAARGSPICAVIADGDRENRVKSLGEQAVLNARPRKRSILHLHPLQVGTAQHQPRQIKPPQVAA